MKKLISAALLSTSMLLGQSVWANTDAEVMRDSLFTIPLSSYQADPNNPNQRLYLKSGAQLNQYQQVIVELPLFLQQNQQHEWELLQPTEANKIAQYFQRQLSVELQQLGISVVTQADANTLRLRSAVTGMGQARPDRKLTDFAPTKAKINLAKRVVGREPYLLMVRTMAQVEDANSGELLAGVVSLKETSKTKVKDQEVTLAYLQKEIDKLAKKNAAQLAHAMGKQ